MEAQVIIAWAALGLGTLALVLGLVFGVRTFRLARVLSATPPTPIPALEPGLHEVLGVVHGEGAVESPLSRQTCVYWRMIIEQRRRNRWETLVDKREAVPCWLDDGGGRVAISPIDADVIVTLGARGTGGIFGYPSAQLSEVLERLREAPEGLAGPYLRYREEVVNPGDRLHAVGTVVNTGDGWEMRKENDVYVISDRDEADMVRNQERLALRWAGLAVAGALAMAWGFLNSNAAALL
ncbi:MAG: hypothetical protein FJ102_00130 [Deltaproteobacteria bacterium]|nr:hypothetical protein [Deltaproteobacteria bacterium]